MIRVAICDDDKHMQESLSKYLLDYSIQCDREIDHAITAFIRHYTKHFSENQYIFYQFSGIIVYKTKYNFFAKSAPTGKKANKQRKIMHYLLPIRCF